MTDEATDTEPDEAGEGAIERPSPAGRDRSLGRRIATIIYWICVIYLITAGFVSVIPQVFWPASQPFDATTCGAGVRQLRTELFNHAGRHLRPGTNPALRPFMAGWDGRYNALAGRCSEGREHRAYGLLGRLRHRMEGTLHRFGEEEATMSRQIDDALGAATEQR